MHFEEDDTRVADEDPEFTGAAATEDTDDEFLADDVPVVDDDADLADDEEEDNDLAADL
jgi:hypothetical protein